MKIHSFAFRWRLLACLLAGVWLSAGCHKSPTPAPAPAENLPTAAVKAQVVASKNRMATEDVVGSVQSRLRAVLEAQVRGRIEKLLVVEGQLVKTGDLLAQLEVMEIRAQLEQATAVREQAATEIKRYAALLEQKTVPQAEYDVRQAVLRVAEAKVREVETLLGYARVTAPFDGIITRKLADVGDLAAPGKPLLAMENPRTLRFEAQVPEALYEHVKMGQSYPVKISAQTQELLAVVSEQSPLADPNSRTFVVKLDLPEAVGLRAGLFGRVTIPVGETTALRVPITAVVKRGQLELVFVVVENRARLHLVKTGKLVGDEVEVVSGLAAGQKIVSEGAARLADGQPLTIQP